MNDLRWWIREMLIVAISLCATATIGCDRKSQSSGSSSAKHPTIASLVPAATDLLRGMGEGDHLVAVSNYDHDAGSLPKVGDYQSMDWEKLAQIRPNCIVTQYGSGHNPPGFVERAKELNIRQVNVHFDRLYDVFEMLEMLGSACDEPAAAAAESKHISDALAAVKLRVQGQRPVRTLIAIGASGTDLAGTGTYLDDLLQQAGGENAVTASGYVTLDREAILALHPDAVLVLLPDANSQTMSDALAKWNSYAVNAAPKRLRIFSFTQSFIMQPGSHVADVAELLAAALHPQAGAASQPRLSRTSP